jgi:hypothetical protein
VARSSSATAVPGTNQYGAPDVVPEETGRAGTGTTSPPAFGGAGPAALPSAAGKGR